MNYLILIIVAIAGIALGAYCARPSSVKSYGRARRKGGRGEGGGKAAGAGQEELVPEQVRQKEENKAAIMVLAREKRKATNDDVEELLGVSDATATRYLTELEEEGALRQVGEAGRHVYYTPTNR